MEVSIGIMAYNEEKNIKKLLDYLLRQRLKEVNIKEIIIVSSGSYDNTNKIVKRYVIKNKKIKLIVQKKREGKASAINVFIKNARSEILILESADTIPKEDTIEKLCIPLKDDKTGIVAGHPIPKDDNKKLLSKVIKLQWELHHNISKKTPKFGEIMAFRKIIKKIENTAVDEEHIGMLVNKKGFKSAYAIDAIVFNKGPQNIKDFILQRRRIYCGHLELYKKRNYKVSTFNNIFLLSEIINLLKINNILVIVIGLFLEGYSRLLGMIDYSKNRRHYVWEVSKTTKR